MTPTTPTTALADLDLDKLEALANAVIEATTSVKEDAAYDEMRSFLTARRTLDLIALARRAAQPVAPVQAQPLKDLEVSVDVSTGEEDGCNRIFARLTGETGSDGTTLLAYEVSRNFAAQPAEGAGQAELDAELRREVAMMYQLLDDGEWGEHIAKTPHGQCLETAITKLVAKAGGAGQAGQVAMTADELAALRRFYECAADGEGYDVPKPMMRRLSEIGVVQRISGAYYHTTEYGLAVLESAERAAAPADQHSAQVKP